MNALTSEMTVLQVREAPVPVQDDCVSSSSKMTVQGLPFLQLAGRVTAVFVVELLEVLMSRWQVYWLTPPRRSFRSLTVSLMLARSVSSVSIVVNASDNPSIWSTLCPGLGAVFVVARTKSRAKDKANIKMSP